MSAPGVTRYRVARLTFGALGITAGRPLRAAAWPATATVNDHEVAG